MLALASDAMIVFSRLGGWNIRILVANDDGVLAPGLWALVEELTKVGDVIVVAPDREQSGVGTGVTLHDPVRASRIVHVPFPVEAYSVQGTPGDCVILGLQSLAGGQVDLVVSGINDGSNLGGDVLVSGTVGAALQAHFHEVPAIAISTSSVREPTFEPAAKLAAALAEELAAGHLPSDLFLNVNMPNRPIHQIKGIAVTRLARRRPTGLLERQKDARGRAYYWLRYGKPEWVAEEGTDLWALRNQMVSITPLQADLVCQPQVAAIEQLCPRLYSKLAPQTSSR